MALRDGPADLSAYGEVVGTDEGKVTLRVARADVARGDDAPAADLPVADLTIEDPPIEDVIESVFADATPAGRQRTRQPPSRRPAPPTDD